MILDFHTHIFPSSIAQKATDNVGNYYGINMEGDGTVGTLIANMQSCGVTHSLVFSSATAATQVVNVNDFVVAQIALHKQLLGFGTIHYEYPDIAGEIKRIKQIGLRGIKMHPDFQNFDMDAPYMDPIYQAAEGFLPIIVHVGDENSVLSAPRKLRNVMDRFPNLTVVAAHMGGYTKWDEAEKYLYGTRAYLDTSSTFVRLTPMKIKQLIYEHGADKVLFGSDYPHQLPSNALRDIHSLDLSVDDQEKVLYKNAAKLLNLE